MPIPEHKLHSTLFASTTDRPVLKYRLLYTRTYGTSCWQTIPTVPPTQTDGLNTYLKPCDKLNSPQRHHSGYCLTKVSPTFGIRMFRELVCYFTDALNLLIFNPLNPELYPICYLLALLGAHHFLHVSRIRVKLLAFRLLMSYIYYIYIYIYIWSTHSWCF